MTKMLLWEWTDGLGGAFLGARRHDKIPAIVHSRKRKCCGKIGCWVVLALGSLLWL